MIGLVVWTKSGGAPYQEDGPRFPVTLGSRGEIASRLGMSRATVKRHWSSFSSAFVETDAGRFTPALTHWRDPSEHGPVDSLGRPLYVRIDERCVAELTSLAKHGSTRTAWAAFRLALRLLPRLRAAAHRGERSVVWTNDQIASQMKMGRTTLTSALALLERRGILVLGGFRYRRISCLSGLLAKVPKVRDRSCPQPVEKSGEKAITPGPQDRSYRDRSSYEVEQDITREQASRGGARDGDCSPSEIEGSLRERLPDLSGKAARELATYCSSALEALDWVYQESNVLLQRGAANPSGIFLYLARSGQSRPGKPSSWSKKLQRRGYHPDRRPLTEEERQEEARRIADLREMVGLAQQKDAEDRAARKAALEEERGDLLSRAREATTLSEMKRVKAEISSFTKRLRGHPLGWNQEEADAFRVRLKAVEDEDHQRNRSNNQKQVKAMLERFSIRKGEQVSE